MARISGMNDIHRLHHLSTHHKRLPQSPAGVGESGLRPVRLVCASRLCGGRASAGGPAVFFSAGRSFVARGPFPRSFCAGRCVLRRVRFGSAARLPRRVRPAGAFVRPGGRFVRPAVAFGVARRLRRIRYPRRRGIDPRDTAPVRAAVGWRLLRWRAGGQKRRGGGVGGVPRRVCSAFVGCVWWRCSRRLFALVADRLRSRSPEGGEFTVRPPTSVSAPARPHRGHARHSVYGRRSRWVHSRLIGGYSERGERNPEIRAKE